MEATSSNKHNEVLMENVITIPSKIEYLRKVEKFVDEISSICKLNSEIYGNVLIATLEAANNAIVHGNRNDESKNVVIKFRNNEHELHITVEDEGPGFDYNNVPDPTAPENIENLSGRGIFLMNKLSDDIKFSEEGRVVEMEFKLAE